MKRIAISILYSFILLFVIEFILYLSFDYGHDFKMKVINNVMTMIDQDGSTRSLGMYILIKIIEIFAIILSFIIGFSTTSKIAKKFGWD